MGSKGGISLIQSIINLSFRRGRGENKTLPDFSFWFAFFIIPREEITPRKVDAYFPWLYFGSQSACIYFFTPGVKMQNGPRNSELLRRVQKCAALKSFSRENVRVKQKRQRKPKLLTIVVYLYNPFPIASFRVFPLSLSLSLSLIRAHLPGCFAVSNNYEAQNAPILVYVSKVACR